MNEASHQVMVATDASINLQLGFSEDYRVLIIPRRLRVGRQIICTPKGPAQFATEKVLPELLPAELEDFINTYQQVSTGSIISIHSAVTLDNAIHQATLARNLLSPRLDIRVFEAKTIDCGVQLFVEAAASFVRNVPQASSDQVIAFLERITGDMTTLLYARGIGELPCEPKLTFLQEISCLFGSHLLLRMDSARGIFKQIGAAQSVNPIELENNQEIVVQWKRRTARDSNRLLITIAQVLSQSPDAFRVREIYLKNPIFPDDFIGVVVFPDAGRIAGLVKFVRRWGSMKN